MEVPQWAAARKLIKRIKEVLILILMEVPQWDRAGSSKETRQTNSLNPYSNGSTTMGVTHLYAYTSTQNNRERLDFPCSGLKNRPSLRRRKGTHLFHYVKDQFRYITLKY